MGVRPAQQWRLVPSGEAVLGKNHDAGFGWDNEFNEEVRFVPAFSIQKYSVTNGDYLEFVKQGAAIPAFWTERNGFALLPRHVRRRRTSTRLARVCDTAASRSVRQLLR